MVRAKGHFGVNVVLDLPMAMWWWGGVICNLVTTGFREQQALVKGVNDQLMVGDILHPVKGGGSLDKGERW